AWTRDAALWADEAGWFARSANRKGRLCDRPAPHGGSRWSDVEHRRVPDATPNSRTTACVPDDSWPGKRRVSQTRIHPSKLVSQLAGVALAVSLAARRSPHDVRRPAHRSRGLHGEYGDRSRCGDQSFTIACWSSGGVAATDDDARRAVPVSA